jgi:hypothetical protein
MLVLQILSGVGVLLLGFILFQLGQISGAITTVSHQLEELGAPLEVRDGMLVAGRTPK